MRWKSRKYNNIQRAQFPNFCVHSKHRMPQDNLKTSMTTTLHYRMIFTRLALILLLKIRVMSHSVPSKNYNIDIFELNSILGHYNFNAKLKCDLSKLCLRARSSYRNSCESIDSNSFNEFLDILVTVNITVDNQYLLSSWKDHCSQQSLFVNKYKSVNHHPICAAAAYAHIPFPLTSNHIHEGKSSTRSLQDTTDLKMNQHTDNSKYKLLVVTLSTIIDWNIPLFRSACFHDIPVTVLYPKSFKRTLSNHQINKKKQKDIYTVANKILSLQQYIFSLNASIHDENTTIILFIDAFDTIFQINTKLILKRFLKTNSKILFSAEHSCFPFRYFPYTLNLGKWIHSCWGDCSNQRYICDEIFPHVPKHLTDKSNRCKQ